MSSLLNNCSDCASLLLSPCDDIVIAAGLDPDTSYWWFVTDQFGNVWKQQATTDVNGVLTIYEYLLPDGFLTAGIGTITIEIKLTEDALETVPLTFANVPYDCMEVSFSSAQSLQQTTTVCIDALMIQLTPADAGGAFSGTGVVSLDGFYYFDPSVSGVGTFTVTYTFGGTETKQQFVVVDDVTITVPADSTVFDTDASFALTGATPTGGTYFIDDVAATTFDPSTVGLGIHTITYQVSSAGCDSFGYYTISVSPAVSVVGCMDPEANNYNALATTPGICTYDAPPLSRDYVTTLFGTTAAEYTRTNVEYATGFLMDIYQPVGDTKTDRAVMMVFHGGGSDYRNPPIVTWCLYWLSKGYVAVSFDYGETGGGEGYTADRQRINVGNTGAADRYLQTNAATYGIDPNKILGHGISAGGETILQFGIVMDNLDDPYFANPNNLLYTGVTNKLLASATMPGNAAPAYTNGSYNGVPYLASNTPPNWWFHGVLDRKFTIQKVRAVYNQEIALGIPSMKTEYPLNGHGLGNQNSDIKAKVTPWFASFVAD